MLGIIIAPLCFWLFVGWLLADWKPVEGKPPAPRKAFFEAIFPFAMLLLVSGFIVQLFIG